MLSHLQSTTQIEVVLCSLVVIYIYIYIYIHTLLFKHLGWVTTVNYTKKIIKKTLYLKVQLYKSYLT